jgi:zeaxanthin epoxidase
MAAAARLTPAAPISAAGAAAHRRPRAAAAAAVAVATAPPPAAAAAAAAAAAPARARAHDAPPLDIVIAGAGIGGLVLALALLRRAQPGAVRLRVFERDLTAIRGEGKYRGPIQVQSNALAALEAIDPLAADAVMAAGCVTGDRVNGLCDGVSGDWYVKFDTFHPAADRGLPVTRVISRVTLQRILAEAVERAAGEHEAALAERRRAEGGGGGGGEGAPAPPPLVSIEGDARVVAFEDGVRGGRKVAVTLADGRAFEADLLVGADGIRSRVRRLLRLGPDATPAATAAAVSPLASADAESDAAAAPPPSSSPAPPARAPPSDGRHHSGDPRDAPTYAGYTCYTGISEFTPPDIDVVGYRVFLGNRKYFVSSDVGQGRMQWYAFHAEPAGGDDADGQRKARLLRLFGHWCPDVVDLIKATPEADVLRRDIYDRPPILSWGSGRVMLLGDSAHAMQPNLGQGGCMAIEDAFELGEIVRAQLAAAEEERRRGAGDQAAAAPPSSPLPPPFDAPRVRREYESRRIVRAGAIHGMARAAAVMASTYKAHLGEGLGPAGEWAAQHLKIPHPGRVAGQAVLSLTMPLVLEWVLGGNCAALERARVPACRLSDAPRGFSPRELREELMRDDGALLRRTRARWLLLAERAPSGAGADPTSTTDVKGVEIDAGEGAVVGRSADAAAAAVGGLPPVAAAASASAADAAADAADARSPSSSSSSFAAAAALCVDDAAVAPSHARVWRDPSTGDRMLQDLGSPSGTFVNGRRLGEGARAALRPGDVVEFGRSPSAEPFRVRLLHESLCEQGVSGQRYTTMVIGARRAGGKGEEEEEDAEAAARAEAERGARAMAEAEAALRASSR